MKRAARIGIRAGLVAAAGIALCSGAAAQDTADQQTEVFEQEMVDESYRTEGGPTLHGKLALSLSEAVSMSLKNNLNVEVARYTPQIADEEYSAAWGAYDPEAFAEVGYLNDEQVNTFALNPVDKAETYQTDGGGGVRGLVPYLNAELSLETAGSRSSTNSLIQRLDPQYDSSLTFSARLPLLKDLLWNPAWTQVQTRRVLEESAFEEFREEVMNNVRDVEAAYWNLIATDEQMGVAEKSLETAQALLDQTETQYEVGVVSKVEVVEARAGVADREFNLIRAKNLYRNAQDRLIDLVLGRGLTAGSQMEIAPTDRPEDYVEYTVDLEAAVSKAFERRPELARARQAVEAQEIQKKFARNQWLPELDLVTSYTTTGTKGDGNRVPNADGTGVIKLQNTGDFGDTYSAWDGGSDHGDSFAIRGVFSIPIGNVTARADLSRAKLELRRAQSNLTRVRQSIILDVRDQARNLESAQEGIGAADRRREAAAEQLRAERIRLEHGESTPFDVLLREQDLVEAESQLIAAFQLYRTSVTNLDRAQGTILETRRISLEDTLAGP